ncbi:MAG: fibrobacter succinogenes major paralogous domain-containing protein [Bacteroidales bacterium]|nr:fibrobacter succinogenes major paralogous domain-containing protein [Bacteroidales bacterium]
MAYGQEESFTTQEENVLVDGQPCPNTATLTDIDGNTYNTVQIGQQCWMKENLRTTKYADNTTISQGSSTSTTTAYWYYPNNSSSNMSTYGLLYNWKAVMRDATSSSANPSGVQGICPNGWHVPSDAEWTQLTDYVSSQIQYVCGSDNTYIAKSLASTTGWNSSTSTCAVGNTPSNNNATGFGAFPAGYYAGSYGSFGTYAYFWSATEGSSGYAYYRSLLNYYAYVSRYYYGKNHGFSVRCVRD